MKSEGKRTNFCSHSANLAVYPWEAHRCTVEPYEPGPTGSVAGRVVAEKGATLSQVIPAVFENGDPVSCSVWTKGSDPFGFCFFDEEVKTRHCFASFVWSDGVLGIKDCKVGDALAVPPLPWSKPGDVDYDWHQAVVVCNRGAVIGSHYHRFLLRFDDGGVFGFFAAQVEAGPFPSSYIRTHEHPVTRKADKCLVSNTEPLPREETRE